MPGAVLGKSIFMQGSQKPHLILIMTITALAPSPRPYSPGGQEFLISLVSARQPPSPTPYTYRHSVWDVDKVKLRFLL